jgi:hypothetical protein
MFACPMSSPKMTRMFGFFSAANVDAVAIAAARVRAANVVSFSCLLLSL